MERRNRCILIVALNVSRDGPAENFQGQNIPKIFFRRAKPIHRSNDKRALPSTFRDLFTTHHFSLLSTYSFLCFYRAMHYSAKRGIAIACCPSVRPSVTLVDQDHIGWKSWKLIARTISLTPSLFVA